jgi:glycosyltransferase involved in cell wall biosynthesis
MRILFLTNAYPDFDSSYRGIFIKKMASFLRSDGYKISVVTPKIYKGSRYFEGQNRIKVYRFPFFARDRLLIEYDRIPYLRMILYYITGVLFTIYVILRHQCRLIHVHWAIPTGLIGVLVGAVLRKPVVVTIHGSDFRLAMNQSSFLKKIFLYVCKEANHLHCVSNGMKRGLEELGINEEKMSAFPMGTEAGFMKKKEVQGAGFNNRPATILSNRNLLPIYNVSFFIRAIPLVLRQESRVRFFIAGDGPEREGLEREVKNLNLGNFVQFLGRIPHDAMLALLSQTDIYVSTSLYDGTSVSLLEALGSGAFPVVTDIPSNREWICDGDNGFLVPTNEEEVLAMRIIEAIRNRALVERARERNLHLVTEKALWPATIEKTRRIYEKVLSSEN